MSLSTPDVMSTLTDGISRVIVMHNEATGELLAEYGYAEHDASVRPLGLTATPEQVKVIVARVVAEHGEFTTVEKFYQVASRVLANQ